MKKIKLLVICIIACMVAFPDFTWAGGAIKTDHSPLTVRTIGLITLACVVLFLSIIAYLNRGRTGSDVPVINVRIVSEDSKEE
ncbi:MAG: hypothetical protein QG669_308 [Patescibacteria group bacterium]|nr:hypothetical protein [Patescibacteria group bacterium]MDQ5961916.1 hypothetical protein [Patescibacteria group bacterium]